MRSFYLLRLGFAMAVVAASYSAMCAAGDVGPSRVVVAVIEPHTAAPGSAELHYSLTLGKAKLTTVQGILDGLSTAKGTHLVLLVHEAVPVGDLPDVVSMASKDGYLDQTVFIFDRNRKGMAQVPGFQWVAFSTDTSTISKLLR